MNPSRREVLSATLAAVPLLAELRGAAAAEDRKGMGVVIHSYGIRRAHPPDASPPQLDDPSDFLDYCVTLKAAGIQTRIGVHTEEYLAKLRAKAEQHQAYLEGIVALPADQAAVPQFEAEVRAAKAAGATVLRTVCLSQRRYEKFATLAAFNEFVKQSWKSLTLAEPVAARHSVQLAIENHKDWRMDELLEIVRRLDSRHVGICLDTGNSIALLEIGRAHV